MKQISQELINKIINALATMTGLNYLTVQQLLQELQGLKDVEKKPEEVKK